MIFCILEPINYCQYRDLPIRVLLEDAVVDVVEAEEEDEAADVEDLVEEAAAEVDGKYYY